MDLEFLSNSIERLRRNTVGDPVWIHAKKAFEYSDQSLEVVVVLKLVRACHGISAANLLCESGLFIDMGAVLRCVSESLNEVYLLLEDYAKDTPWETPSGISTTPPGQPSTAEKFVKNFFAKTIDSYLTAEEDPIQSKKARTAHMRFVTGKEQDEQIRQHLSNIFKTFSGYIHGDYAHIMEMFGPLGDSSFNVNGINNFKLVLGRSQVVEQTYKSVIYTIAVTALLLKQDELFCEMQAVVNNWSEG